MSDLAEAAIGENAINGGSETIPGTWYLALFKSGAESTLETGSAAQEVQTSATAGYNRQAMAISDDSSGGTISYSNAAAETFTASGSAWSDVYFVGLCESQTPGTDDVWYYGPLTTAITNIGDGSSVQFAIGEIDIPVT
jgi:hypothetical protein